MIRTFLVLLLTPMMLFGALTFNTGTSTEIQVVRSFDLPPSFLNDAELQKIIKQKRSKYTNRHFFQSLDKAYLFIPMIKEILADSNVPSEFLFMAMAESGFSLEAYSNKKASGLWQFIPETGRRYGLRIDQYVDERRDLVKSTKAAVKYLEALHARFGKWYLAAIAYNCGEGRVVRAIERAGTDDIAVLLDPKRRYLPYESRRYIRKIVALTLLASDEDFMIKQEYDYLMNRANAYSIARVEVAKGERLSRVAKQLQMPEYKLTALNRHLNYDFVPPHADTYEIYIPYVKLSEFRQKYKPAPMDQYYIVHKVKPGESLSRIGSKYKVSYKMIQDFNRLKSTRLQINQKLIIPVEQAPKPKQTEYIVKAGDSLAKIARVFKVSIAELKKINNLDSDIIRIGDTLSLYD